jgi:hypothetical protein
VEFAQPQKTLTRPTCRSGSCSRLLLGDVLLFRRDGCQRVGSSTATPSGRADRACLSGCGLGPAPRQMRREEALPPGMSPTAMVASRPRYAASLPTRRFGRLYERSRGDHTNKFASSYVDDLGASKAEVERMCVPAAFRRAVIARSQQPVGRT